MFCSRENNDFPWSLVRQIVFMKRALKKFENACRRIFQKYQNKCSTYLYKLNENQIHNPEDGIKREYELYGVLKNRSIAFQNVLR